jgi:hypothetical protein
MIPDLCPIIEECHERLGGEKRCFGEDMEPSCIQDERPQQIASILVVKQEQDLRTAIMFLLEPMDVKAFC